MLGRKIINNPGFDFYTEKDYYVTAGEAKYKNGSNPYNISLSQIKTPKLLKNITNSKYFKECNKSHIIYLIAVEMV